MSRLFRAELMLPLFVCFLVGGCMRPPAKMVVAEVDGAPVMAWDMDEDQQPDLKDNGEVDVVPGSAKILKGAGIVDSIGPTTLGVLGSITGLSLLGGLGVAWKKWKFGRIIANTVMTVQAARKRLKKSGMNEALNVVDETLGSQTPETTAMVRDVKEKMKLPSVN